MREIFAGSPLELDLYPGYGDVEETGSNYAQNAMLKARSLFLQLREAAIEAAVLADDSGIEVDAMKGRPGVLSARYKPGVSWPERLDAILAEVDARPDHERGAKFVCAMALILPNGSEVEGYGEVHGYVARAITGANGFGYDPIFYYYPIGKTFGEIPESAKNKLSHRANAARSLLQAYAAR